MKGFTVTWPFIFPTLCIADRATSLTVTLYSVTMGSNSLRHSRRLRIMKSQLEICKTLRLYQPAESGRHGTKMPSEL